MLKLQWRRVRSKYPWLQIVQTWRFWVLVMFTVTLFIYVISSYGGRSVNYMEKEIKEVTLGNIEFDFYTGLFFHKEGKKVNLRGLMPDSRQLDGLPSHCGVYNASKCLCASWFPKMKLQVENIVAEQAKCQVLTWTSVHSNVNPNTCFSMRDVHWYGGALLHEQTWPLNKADVTIQPYILHDEKSYKGETNTFGNVLDWFWFSSSGIAVILDDSYPVHVSSNRTGEKTLCFYSKSGPKPVLKFTICKANNVRKIHRYVIKKFVHLPLRLPKDSFFQDPMWSTNPVFRNSVDQGKLLKYAKEVGDNYFQSSVLDIYENRLAVLKLDANDNSMLDMFDKTKFPNSQQSLMLLREYNFDVLLPVSPFTPAADQTSNKNKLLLDETGEPFVIDFQGQDVNIINLMDETVADWYINEILKLKKEFGFSGLHLVGGFSDIYTLLNNSFSSVDMHKFTRRLISSVSETTDLTVFSDFAVSSQKHGLIVQLAAQTSSWTGPGGLQHLIPSVLTLGLLGYPFVIPNTIGGPGTFKIVNATYTEHIKPERELYIRWMGLSAYMPCMLFSYPPWAYDEEMVAIAKEFTKQHIKIVAPLAIKAAKEYEHIGSPIVRPLWWIDPLDSTALTIDDEYLIYDTLLVAPIVHAGKMQRDIYIPQGKWKDVLNNTPVEGATWLRNYMIPLDKVATFVVVK